MWSCANGEPHKEWNERVGRKKTGGKSVRLEVEMGSREEECKTFDTSPVAVYTVVSPWHHSPDLISVSRREKEQLANSCTGRTVTQLSETDRAPSAARAPMDRHLCDCVTALAVLLCVATQVRPPPAYLQTFIRVLQACNVKLFGFFPLLVNKCLPKKLIYWFVKKIALSFIIFIDVFCKEDNIWFSFIRMIKVRQIKAIHWKRQGTQIWCIG